MKQCPVCQKSYLDESLQYCLEDGATLTFSSDEQPTQIISPVNNPINNPIRFNIAKESAPTFVTEPKGKTTEPIKKEGSGYNLIIGLVGGFIISAILAAGMFAGFLWMRNKDSGQNTQVKNSVSSPTVTPPITPTSSQTPDDAAILKEKIANLEKKMQEQKNQKTSVPTISETKPDSSVVTARVNSPGDGFLALRTEPSAVTGARILQIPHGSNLSVLACLPKAAGKKGRWCRVNYNGNVGWAFDGFLIY